MPALQNQHDGNWSKTFPLCPLAEARSYVNKSIATSVEVVSSQMNSIGVRGTPTVLLVDGNGKVEQAWVGKLTDQGHRQVQSVVM